MVIIIPPQAWFPKKRLLPFPAISSSVTYLIIVKNNNLGFLDIIHPVYKFNRIHLKKLFYELHNVPLQVIFTYSHWKFFSCETSPKFPCTLRNSFS